MGGTLSSLRKQLAEAEENLRLIQERKAEYVEPHRIDLDLIKVERHWESQIADLKMRLAQLMSGPCPYRGLEPFEAEHAEFYFGREAMVERLVAKLVGRPFVAVVGPSGCGKSSLMRAGLVTALREEALPDSRKWEVRLFRPEADPLRALVTPLVVLLEPDATEVTHLAEARKLADHLRDGTLPMADVASRLRDKYPDLSHLVLVADQFEELYTECQDEALRQAFVEALLAAADEEGVSVVLTLRADFYGRALADRRLGGAVDAGLVNVLPMSEGELEAAVEKPALKAGREFEPGLVARVVDDVAGEPGNLPLLEFALTELWARQTAQGVLTHAAYEAIGQVRGAIAQRAEAVYGEIAEKGHGETVQRVFLRLTHYGEGAEGTRRRATLDDLVTPRTPRGELETVVKALSDARLLVTGRADALGAATTEVAHEALIRGWERLGRWVDEDRAFGLWRERLAAARRMWEETGRDEGALLRGAVLAEAEGWLVERADDLNQVERSFIQASIAARDRAELEEKRRTQMIIAGLTVGLILVAIGALYGFVGQRNSDIARATAQAAEATAVVGQAEAEQQASRNQRSLVSMRLAVEARNVLDQNVDPPDLILMLARKAVLTTWESDDTVVAYADAVLHRAVDTFLDPPLTLTLPPPHHTSFVNSVAFSPDGQMLVTGGSIYGGAAPDSVARIWDVATGRAIGVIEGHPKGIRAAVFSPDGQTLVTAGGDGTARLWNVATGQEIRRFEGHTYSLWSVPFSPNGESIVTTSDDQTARLWDVATGEEIRRFVGHQGRVTSASFSPDGQTLVTAGHDRTARLWDVATGEEIRRFEGHKHPEVRSVAFSPDGQMLVTAGGQLDAIAYVWDVTTGDEVSRLEGHTHSINTAAFSPDGLTIVTASYDQTARLWEVATGQEIRRFEGHTYAVEAAAFSPDGQTVATASRDQTVRLWDVATGEEIRRFEGPSKAIQISFNPDGQTIAIIGWDQAVRLWDATTRREIRRLQSPTGWANSAAFSLDGQIVVVAGDDGIARLWDVTTGEQISLLEGHTDAVNSAAFSPDGRTIITAGGDGTVRLWNATTGREVSRLGGHAVGVNVAAFSPDGRIIVTAGRDQPVRLWNAATGEVIRELQGHIDTTTSTAFSSDSQIVATIGGVDDQTIQLWDVATGKEIRRLEGHIEKINAVAFSPGDQTILTASDDWTVRLWNVTTGELVRMLEGHTGAVTSAAFGPDGRTIVTASEDGTIRVWPSIEGLLELAQSLIQRDPPVFTAEERLRFELE